MAGFNGRLGRLEEVNPFIDAAEVDFDLLKRQIDERVVIYSEGDDRVQPDFSLAQAESQMQSSVPSIKDILLIRKAVLNCQKSGE